MITKKGKGLRIVAAIAFLFVPIARVLGNVFEFINDVLILEIEPADYFAELNWVSELYAFYLLLSAIIFALACFLRNKKAVKILLTSALLLFIISKMSYIPSDFEMFFTQIFEAGEVTEIIRAVWEFVFVHITDVIALLAGMIMILGVATEGKVIFISSAVLAIVASVMTFIDYGTFLIEQIVGYPQGLFNFSSYMPYFVLTFAFYGLGFALMYFAMFMLGIGVRGAFNDKPALNEETVQNTQEVNIGA